LASPLARCIASLRSLLWPVFENSWRGGLGSQKIRRSTPVDFPASHSVRAFPGQSCARRTSNLTEFAYAAPDDSTPPIGVLLAGESTTPVAESQGGAGGVKWYLVKPKPVWSDGLNKKLNNSFKSLPGGRSALVSVALNQTVSDNFVLDIGTTNTVISRGLTNLLSLRTSAKRIFKTAGGPGRSRPYTQMLEPKQTNLTVAVHDFSPNPRLKGLLGMDFLGRYEVGLDFTKAAFSARTKATVLLISLRKPKT
jgi:hypothetical protein